MNPEENQLVRFDWAIKTLLRDKANFDVLEGFISAVLGEEMKVVNILENKSNQSDDIHKINLIDLLVKNQKQQSIIIEIQNHHIVAYPECALFGVSKLITDTILPNNDYREANKVILISIVYFNLGLDDDYVYYGNTDFRGLHYDESFTSRRLIDPSAEEKTFETVHAKDIFPEYYLINVERFTDAINNDLDEWIYLLKHSAVRPDFKAKHIDSAREKLALLKMTHEQRRRYDQYLLEIVNDKNIIQTAQQEGANTKALEIARKMQEAGVEIEQIATFTGLSPEMIEQADTD
jgi:predicted transposase/invertase (TIGR01784 family)